MDIPPHYIFIGIMLIVPAQYFMSPETAHIKWSINNYFRSWLEMFSTSPKNDINEEVQNLVREDISMYGMGKYVRERSPKVLLRVGDVVRHKEMDVRGVIVGWDEKAIAPANFLKDVHKGNLEWSNNPNYAVLVDVRDRLTPQLGYFVQENLIRDQEPIMHPLLDKYFEYYDEKTQRYVMRPFHKELYPDD